MGESGREKRQPELTLVGGDGKRTSTDTARLYLEVAHFKKAYATQTQRTGVQFKRLGTPTPLWETCPRADSALAHISRIYARKFFHIL